MEYTKPMSFTIYSDEINKIGDKKAFELMMESAAQRVTEKVEKAKNVREQITNEVLKQFHRKVRNVWEIENSGVFVVEGNNQSIICHAMLSKDGTILLVE